MLRLTRTGKVFLGVIVVMHLASITSQSGLLIWIVGLVAATLAVNAFAAMRSVRNVEIKAPRRIMFEEGTAPREPWQLVNKGKRPARMISVERGSSVWLQSAEIQAASTNATTPRNVFSQRGVYPLNEAWLVSLYPFGLVKAMRAIDTDAEALVFPKLYATAPPVVRGLDPMIGGRQTGAGRAAVGEKFAGVRAFQSGDSLKRVHWKSSAKGGGLMVKTFEEELAGRATLLVFCEAGPQAEACLRAAGSLAIAGIEAGHQVEFHNLNESRLVRIPPFGDRTALLEELARFRPGAASPRWPVVLPRRSGIHVIATSLPEEIGKQVEEWVEAQKLVVVHLPEGSALKTSATVRSFPAA